MKKNKMSYENWIGVFANLATTVMLFLGLLQFCSYRHDLKEQRMLELSKRFYEEPISSAWVKISLNFTDRDRINNIRDLAKPKYRVKAVKSYLRRKAQDNESSWFLILEYFSSVSRCVSKKVCSDDLSYNIKSNGMKFFRNYGPFICHYFKIKNNFDDKKEILNSFKFYLGRELVCHSAVLQNDLKSK